MPPIRGYVFDAYGTLFDVHSVVEAGHAVTADPMALSLAWRQKQLEYTWLRSLMGRYVDFWTVTEDALRWAIAASRSARPRPTCSRLMDAYLSLACFPRSVDPRSHRRPPARILSNGAPRMLGGRPSRRAGSDEASGSRALGRRGQDLQAVTDGVRARAESARIAASELSSSRRTRGTWPAQILRLPRSRGATVKRPEENLGVSPDTTIRSLADLPT
jgi:HAD superfamily hydrolase (TIGR01493 family)